MPSSLFKNGGLILFVTHMKIISFSCAFRICFFLFKIKKSQIKKSLPRLEPETFTSIATYAAPRPRRL